jgi:uncharacterized phage protein (TIGR01671 family)
MLLNSTVSLSPKAAGKVRKMKREITFRGKYSKEHEWVYGYYYNNCDCGTNQDVIIRHNPEKGTGEEVIIDSRFLGQDTGLTDNNNKRIFEGDIVQCGYGTGVVIFNVGCFMVQWLDDKEAYMEFLFSRKGTHRRKGEEVFEIIGNIHDNPEILKSFLWLKVESGKEGKC